MGKEIIEIRQPKPIIDQRPRVAAYARVSCGKDTMLRSLAAQVDYYRNLIIGNVQWQFAGVFADEAKTGTKEDRAEFQALLDKCRAGEVDMVITKSISRFARNTVTLLNTVRELKGIGVDVFFEEQNIHSVSGDGEFILTLLASFAQAESFSVSENIKWRIRKDFEEGKPTWFRMLGYRMVDGQITVVPEEVETVRLIYDLYLQGYSIRRIANMLNRAGRMTVNGCSWSMSNTSRILDNEKYCGDLRLQKTYVVDHIGKRQVRNTGQLPSFLIPDNHEAIIEKDRFRQVVEERNRRGVHERKAPAKSVFTGKICCACCGKNYRRKTTTGGIKWCCATYNSMGKPFCPDSKMIPEDTLIEATREILGDSVFAKNQFSVRVDHIDACPGNILQFHFTNGNTQDYVWQDRSRSESWTPEMRAAARKAAARRLDHDG